MDREPWHAAAPEVTKRQTSLSDWTELITQKLKWPTHLAKILGIICYFIFTTNPHILRRLKKN